LSQHKKNIVCLSSWYPTPENPFLGNFIERQIKLLGTIYSIQFIQTVEVKDQNNVAVLKNEKGTYTEITASFPAVKSKLLKKYYESLALKKAIRSIEKPDLLFSYIFLPKIWQFLFVKKKLNCPWIHLEQGSYFRSEIQEKWSPIHRFWIKKAYNKINTLFAVSALLEKDMLLVNENRSIKRAKNHIDTQLFSYKEKVQQDKIHFLHVSTLDKKTKNPKGIFDACKQLTKTTKNFILTIISDEPTTEWELYTKEIGIQANIQFIGPQKWEDLPAFYHEADAFILNSNYETFSIVLAEAWATGTPTITTSVGIGFELPPFLGIQTEINTSHSLFNAMQQFMHKVQQFDGLKISEYAQQFNAPTVLTELAFEIDQLIEKNAR
jgi:glycosyltransferase involved in cell wall biosynthesis